MSSKRKHATPPSDEESSSSDSGYDTDDIISFARKSGKIGSKAKGAGVHRNKKAKAQEPEEVVKIDFSFFDPVSSDYHSVKTLLRHYIQVPKEEDFRVDQLSNLVSNQVVVGTMVKTQDTSEAPIAFATALNLHAHKNNGSIKQVRQFLTGNCPQTLKAALEKALADESKQAALLIHERVVNLPTELVPPLHDSLRKDVLWAQKNEVTQQLRDAYKFEHYILVTRRFTPASKNPAKAASSSSSASSSSTTTEEKTSEEQPYFKFEDEIYREESTLSFEFPAKIRNPVSEMDHLDQTYVAILLDRDGYNKAVDRITNLPSLRE